MPRRKVQVQLDDDLVERLDVVAERLGMSRSELLRRGANAVLAADGLATADAELQAAYERVPPDRRLVQAARRLASETAPER